VGPRTFLDGCRKPSPHRDSIAHSESQYRLSYPDPQTAVLSSNFSPDPFCLPSHVDSPENGSGFHGEEPFAARLNRAAFKLTLLTLPKKAWGFIYKASNAEQPKR